MSHRSLALVALLTWLGCAADDALSAAGDDPSEVVTPRLLASAQKPNGWDSSWFVFAQGRLKDNGKNDERVELGWYELRAGDTVSACGGSGPKVKKRFHAWAHEDYLQGDCGGRDHWDHGSTVVDNCPGGAEWTKGYSLPRGGCQAHVPSGFGEAGNQTVWTGRFKWDDTTSPTRMTFFFSVDGKCQKEYWAARTDADLIVAQLNGDKTGNRDGDQGTGATHGFAYGSNRNLETFKGLDTAVGFLRTTAIIEDVYWLREHDGFLSTLNKAKPFGDYAKCRDGVWFNHNCVDPPTNDADHTEPYLDQCPAGKTAYLNFIMQPFSSASRQNLHWGWHAGHLGWRGGPSDAQCYHGGSHSRPFFQIIDRNGEFRGYVGIEFQRDAASWDLTNYKVMRWVPSALRF